MEWDIYESYQLRFICLIESSTDIRTLNKQLLNQKHIS